MLERLWTSILDLVAQFVTPDWGVLVSLLPVGIFVLIVVVLVRIFVRLMTAPPARRGRGRLKPKTPAGIHMPGPSFAPAFAGVGLFLVMLGLVFGGVTLVLGIIALVLTLLYWLSEGLRLYDRDVGPTTPALPATVHDGPPPGVHMPGPTWRPFLAAFGLFSLLLGLVFGGWLLAVGVIALVSTLIGWLSDAVQEYRKAVEADTTGHLENPPPPSRAPSRLLGTLIVLIVGAAVLQSGLFTAGSANGGTATGSPGPSGAPGSGSAPSGAPGSGGPPPASAPAADVQLEAKGITFVEKTFNAPANKPFTIAFANEDPGTPHNVELKDGSGKKVFEGDVFNGVATKVYSVPALPAGTYTFLCVVHSTMTGTATLQ